ncbi:MAG: hypothetical protein EP338_05820 [Bacteroidetes bacterium]|nr:MAG: hypothetical protein EP338_05820 [Bacteroidota bacterium]
MKTSTRIWKASVMMLLLIFVGSMGCKKPTEGVKLIYGTNTVETSIALQFFNAATGEAIGMNGEKVEITVEGRDKDLVVDNAGGNRIKVVNGIAVLGIKKGTVISEQQPLKFHVVAHVNGYLSTSVSYTIVNTTPQYRKVYMVQLGNEPGGVATAEDHSVTTNASGITSQTVVVNTPLPNTTFEKTGAVVTIPAGTQLLDEFMMPVTGNITTTLTYFNNLDETSLQSFPGGFAVTTEEFGDIVFKTAGFIAMEMKNDQGVEVKNFGTPIQMKVEIPAQTSNEKGEQITEGMIVPIWSYEPENGNWTKESEPQIEMNNASGKYEVNYDMIHLSYWNLDWHYPGSCSVGAEINITTESNTPYELRLYYADGTMYGYAGYHSGNYSFNFINAFPNQPMVLKAFETGTGCSAQVNVMGQVSIQDLCSGNYQLNLQPISSTNKEIVVKVNATCANRPGHVIRPTAQVWALDLSCPYYWILVGNMENGELKTSALEYGKTYYFGAVLGGEWLQHNESFTIDQEEYSYNQELPANLCHLFN